MTSTPILEVFVHEDESDDPMVLATVFSIARAATPATPTGCSSSPSSCASAPARVCARASRTPDRSLDVADRVVRVSRLASSYVADPRRIPCPKPSSLPPPARRSGVPTRVARRVPSRRPVGPHHRRRARKGARARPRTASRTDRRVRPARRRVGLQHRARGRGMLAGLDVPGVTVNRYCSSSLQTIRMAAHAIKAGEGDVFVSAGVETVSRFNNGAADSGTRTNPSVRRRRGAHAGRARREVTEPWTPPSGPARRLHRHGPDRRERRASSKA